MDSIGQLNRSVYLGSNAGDWARYQKAVLFKAWLAKREGIRDLDLPQIIAARKDASSLLRAMGEIPPRSSADTKT